MKFRSHSAFPSISTVRAWEYIYIFPWIVNSLKKNPSFIYPKAIGKLWLILPNIWLANPHPNNHFQSYICCEVTTFHFHGMTYVQFPPLPSLLPLRSMSQPPGKSFPLTRFMSQWLLSVLCNMQQEDWEHPHPEWCVLSWKTTIQDLSLPGLGQKLRSDLDLGLSSWWPAEG